MSEPEDGYVSGIPSLPEGFTPIDSILIAKTLNTEGSVGLFIAATNGLSPWEAVGMLQGALDEFRNDLAMMMGHMGADDEEEEEQQ